MNNRRNIILCIAAMLLFLSCGRKDVDAPIASNGNCAQLPYCYIVNDSLDSLIKRILSEDSTRTAGQYAYTMILMEADSTVYAGFINMENLNEIVDILNGKSKSTFYKKDCKPTGCAIYGNSLFVIIDDLSKTSSSFYQDSPYSVMINKIEENDDTILLTGEHVYFVDKLRLYKYADDGFHEFHHRGDAEDADPFEVSQLQIHHPTVTRPLSTR